MRTRMSKSVPFYWERNRSTILINFPRNRWSSGTVMSFLLNASRLDGMFCATQASSHRHGGWRWHLGYERKKRTGWIHLLLIWSRLAATSKLKQKYPKTQILLPLSWQVQNQIMALQLCVGVICKDCVVPEMVSHQASYSQEGMCKYKQLMFKAELKNGPQKRWLKGCKKSEMSG